MSYRVTATQRGGGGTIIIEGVGYVIIGSNQVSNVWQRSSPGQARWRGRQPAAALVHLLPWTWCKRASAVEPLPSSKESDAGQRSALPSPAQIQLSLPAARFDVNNIQYLWTITARNQNGYGLRSRAYRWPGRQAHTDSRLPGDHLEVLSSASQRPPQVLPHAGAAAAAAHPGYALLACHAVAQRPHRLCLCRRGLPSAPTITSIQSLLVGSVAGNIQIIAVPPSDTGGSGRHSTRRRVSSSLGRGWCQPAGRLPWQPA